MNKPYFTRKNLIAIAISLFYSFIIVFVGMCIDGSYSFMSKKNPIAALAKTLGFQSIIPGLSGFVCLILVAVFITVFITSFLYIRRYNISNNKKPYRPKMIALYLVVLLLCVALSIGIGIAMQLPTNVDNIKLILKFVWQSIILATMIFIVLFALIGGVLMFATNYILLGKPFRAYQENEPQVFEDTPEVDVTNSFDVSSSDVTSQVGSVGGIQAGVGGGAGEGYVKASEELDDREKVFPGLSTIDVDYDGYAVEKEYTDNYSLEEICVKFRNYLAKEEKLYFEMDVIRFFISGFAASHFMILEGLSGTGKSSLPRYFAKFINSEVLFVPVQATWRDKTNLIGYFNDFSKTYSETEFLLKMYQANYNPDKLYFFVLDEMNISRVEYYFADFLSVLEYPENLWKIKIMQLPFNFIPPAKLEEGIIQIPSNSYFVGTANKDDSTFTITDKVYDRAITIEFDNRNESFEVKEDVSTIHLSKSHLHNLYTEAINNPAGKMTQADFEKFQKITDYIYQKFDITFGNRILNQIENIVPVYVATGGEKTEALDFLLSRKVISKIEGRFEDYVKGALKDLLVLIEKTYGANVLKRSEKTIQSLMRRL